MKNPLGILATSVLTAYAVLSGLTPSAEAKAVQPHAKCAALAAATIEGEALAVEEHRKGEWIREFKAASIVELSARLQSMRTELAGTEVGIAIAGGDIAGAHVWDFLGCLIENEPTISDSIARALMAERPYLVDVDPHLIDIDVQAAMVNFDHIVVQAQAMVDAMLERALGSGGNWREDRGQGTYDLGCGFARVLYDEPCLCAKTNKVYLGSSGCDVNDPKSSNQSSSSGNSSSNNGANNGSNQNEGDPAEESTSDSDAPLDDPDAMPGEEQCLVEGEDPESLWYWSEVFGFDASDVLSNADYNNFNMRVFAALLETYTAALR
ncbi:MAG: hypothetical protein AAGM22_18930 [Acidobacteriota bacterium]